MNRIIIPEVFCSRHSNETLFFIFYQRISSILFSVCSSITQCFCFLKCSENKVKASLNYFHKVLEKIFFFRNKQQMGKTEKKNFFTLVQKINNFS